ncbi:four-carbon acid sugar kinase family protein [Acuticoccus sp. MNP-M23]|uniref:four-carbon acid sugar kinase family protein n=1 Tax=Acuticoccus sp. MNP-M23 TaxID=3072793 RepID=UPI00281629F7|nr:four-carbon acid sugar kinase family protein [Acuticoccus sp. MNP-M23]WMS41976.1 four-carbon acid sugar kinase family protein [Acuticoccus sp. MNP-M23]
MNLPAGPLIAWYGDDFTGASAVMEVLTFAGFPSVLFFDPPDAARLARFGTLRAIGIAGDARTRDPAWMEANLPPVYAALRATGAPVTHYKVCSTFDSAPDVGSIGKAADLGIAADGWAPLVVGAPEIGRWQAFGTLFAAAGDTVHRLDRHPTMAVHPVTPMDEADVCRHLGRQTERRVGLVDLVALKAGRGADALKAARAGGNTIVAFDVVDDETLAAAGALIWAQAMDAPLFALGSQGVEYALVAAWRAAGVAPPPAPPQTVAPVHRLAIVSGSCSPITAGQIAHAEADGFAIVPLDPAAAVDEAAWGRAKDAAAENALALLGQGRNPLVCTARGPDDRSISAFREAVAQSGTGLATANTRIGEGLGEILNRIVRDAGLTRAAIAGGDTSSAAARGLGIYAVTAEAPLVPGAALLKAHGDDPATDGVQIALKGGQMGPPDFFSRMRAGSPCAQ